MRSATRYRRKGGFTLIEALASLMLVAVVLPLVVRGVTMSAKSAADYDRRATAMMLAQSQMEEAILAEAWTFGDSEGVFEETYGEEAERYAWAFTTTDWGEGTDYRELRLRVVWNSGGADQSVVLTTVVYAGN
jgi:type II secretory pathway pseudopilin PulG